MFETWQENPELIWNARAKEKVVSDLRAAKSSVLEALEADKAAYWKPGEDAIVSLEDIQVGGVFLNLFVRTPSWSVRRPRDFLLAILEAFVEHAGKPTSERNPEHFDLIGKAAVVFLTNQPSIADYIVALGYIPRVVKLCEHDDDAVRTASVRVVHAIAASKACVESMNTIDPVASLMRSLDRIVGDELGIIMDCFERLMARSSDKANMLKYAVQSRLTEKLLPMLETGMVGHQSASSARAIIIKVLKTMSRVDDPIYGPQINAILNGSTIWWKYKDQNHELFLTSAAFGGFITGPTASAGQAGGSSSGAATLFLAAGPAHTPGHEDEPPPLS